MKHLTISLLLALISLGSFGQQHFSIDLGKTSGTRYATPALGISSGYKAGMVTTEIGFKTNWTEYYSMAYLHAGMETSGRLFFGISAGPGYTLNIPQLDRLYNPETGKTDTISMGYATKGIWDLNAKALIGYKALKIGNNYAAVYASGTVGFRSYFSVGIKFSSDKNRD